MSGDAEIAEAIRERGWYGISIPDADPPFAYTVGLLTQYQHPELIVFGWEESITGGLLSTLVDRIQAGESFAGPAKYELPEAFQIATRRVHHARHMQRFGYAMGHLRHVGYDGDLEAVQVFWPDLDGVFPFEAGCNWDVYAQQPRLDRPLTPTELEEQKRWLDGL